MVENYLFVELFHFHNKRNLTSLFGKYKWTFSMSSEEEYTPYLEIASESSACNLKERCIPFVMKNKEEFNMSTTTKEKGKGNGKTGAGAGAGEGAGAVKKIVKMLCYSDINSSLPVGQVNPNGTKEFFRYNLEGSLTFELESPPIAGKMNNTSKRYLLENITLYGMGNTEVNPPQKINVIVTYSTGKKPSGIKPNTLITPEMRDEFTGGERKDPIERCKNSGTRLYNALLNFYNESARLGIIKKTDQDSDDLFKVCKRFACIAKRAGCNLEGDPVKVS